MKLETYLRKKRISQSAFARTVGVTQGAVWQWINSDQQVSPERAVKIETATEGAVSRQELRPDLWPAS